MGIWLAATFGFFLLLLAKTTPLSRTCRNCHSRLAHSLLSPISWLPYYLVSNTSKGDLKKISFCGIIARVAVSPRIQTPVGLYPELSGFIALPSKNKSTNAKFLSNVTVDSDHARMFVNLANNFFPIYILC